MSLHNNLRIPYNDNLHSAYALQACIASVLCLFFHSLVAAKGKCPSTINYINMYQTTSHLTCHTALTETICLLKCPRLLVRTHPHSPPHTMPCHPAKPSRNKSYTVLHIAIHISCLSFVYPSMLSIALLHSLSFFPFVL